MTLIKELYNNRDYYKNLIISLVRDDSGVDDIIQNTLVKILTKDYVVENIKAFLSRAVINQALNYNRINRKFCYDMDDNFFQSLEDLDNPEFLVLKKNSSKEILTKLNDNIKNLPKKQKEAINLWYGLSDTKKNRKPRELNYETFKANKRYALLNLKKNLDNNKDLCDEYFEHI